VKGRTLRCQKCQIISPREEYSTTTRSIQKKKKKKKEEEEVKKVITMRTYSPQPNPSILRKPWPISQV
jgi:Zn-finger protein